MRPEVLFPLFAPATALTGVGPRSATLIERLAGANVVDLLWHLPSGIIDRRYAPALADAEPGRVATVTVTIGEHRAPPPHGRAPYRVHAFDDTGALTLTFFHARADYLRRTLPHGQQRVISGQLESYGGDLQMTHPDHIVPPAQGEQVRIVEPTYRLTGGLTPRALGRAIAGALGRAPDLPEWLVPALTAREDWPTWREAIIAVHAPRDAADLEPTTAARRRLAYDELLAGQLAVALMRATMKRQSGRATAAPGALREKALAALPFNLTASQRQAVAEIDADMGSSLRMLRLLQGDVGSGKTVVAFLAMLTAVEAGHQAALMAPTEILARQHYATIAPLAAAAGVEVGLLTGRERGRAREAALKGLADGSVALAVGTHALFQAEVAFADLALAVIDEQHRFGVHQRLLLAGKGTRAADTLVMTATPIPRTLMLAAYGDLDGSRLTEKPAGRKPVDTRAMPLGRLDDVVAAIGRALGRGAKVFWVCPLVEESEASDLSAATERHAALHDRFGDRVGLVHGRMKGPEKDAAMARFANGDMDLLVATTVIEVGVDVPAASVMVVEQAERFGLAQLHQLRGRIGRGKLPGTCLLLYRAPLGETARARLNILRETDDGFRIAQEDLRLRGAGDMLGTRQSGLPDLRLADLSLHGDLLAMAQDDARLVLECDPDLASNRGHALRVLLYLFERDAAVKYLRAA